VAWPPQFALTIHHQAWNRLATVFCGLTMQEPMSQMKVWHISGFREATFQEGC
jgi:hypothetical protein